jgi:hypothetical protein
LDDDDAGVERAPGRGRPEAGSAGGGSRALGGGGARWWSADWGRGGPGEGRGGAARPPWSRGRRTRVGAGEQGARARGRRAARARWDRVARHGGVGRKNGDRTWRPQKIGSRRQDLWRRPHDTSQPARPPRQADRRQKCWCRHTQARRQR